MFFKKPDTKWNKRNGALRIKPHPANLPVCENQIKKSSGSEGNHGEQRTGEGVPE